MRVETLIDMNELVCDGETFACLRAVRGKVNLDLTVLNRVATMDTREKSVIEAMVFNLEPTQVLLEGLETDWDRERRHCNQDIVDSFTEIGLPMLELGVVQLLERVRKIGRVLT